MSYTIEAFIVRGKDDEVANRSGHKAIPLPQKMRLIPFRNDPSNGSEKTILGAAESAEVGPHTIPEAVASLAEDLSHGGMVAYLEAEIFGGEGLQASAVWEWGKIIDGPVVDERAINRALKVLGVEAGESIDEFDALGLGRYRSTEEWLKGGET